AGRTGRNSALGLAPFRAFAQFHLALRAEVGGAAGDDDPLDHSVAVLARAGPALAGVDEKALLHAAFLAASVAVVVDRGAAGFERRDRPVAERLPVLRLHRPRRGQRVQARPVERLVGVDVADPGDARLVEQERLQRRLLAGRDLPQLRRGELGRERLDPEPG